MRTLIYFSTLLVASFLVSCSDSSSPNNNTGNGTVVMSSELASNGRVGSTIAPKGETPESGFFVDSLRVTYAGVIVSNLKMHTDAGDSTEDDATIKTGPFLVEFDSSGTHIVTSASIPAGTYDRIKFEIHKLNNGVDDSLIANVKIQDFFNNNATIKIVGYVWDGGVQIPFTYYSSITENIQTTFSPAVTVAVGGTVNTTLQFDPSIAFIVAGTTAVLDPRDASNNNAIKLALMNAFKAYRKS